MESRSCRCWLVVDSAFGAVIVVVGLVTNAADIGSDLTSVLALWRLPPGILVYYSDEGQLESEPAAPIR